MKFWRHIFLTVFLVAGVTFSIFQTSCIQNVCDNVTCQNGGSCSNGMCLCPTGYEGNQCQTLSTARFVGAYVGFTSCNAGPNVLDTVWIYADSHYGIAGVEVDMKSLFNLPEDKGLLYGTVNDNLSVYSIVISNNDSTDSLIRDYTITLQDNTTLKVNEYIRDFRNPADTISESCQFYGDKID